MILIKHLDITNVCEVTREAKSPNYIWQVLLML